MGVKIDGLDLRHPKSRMQEATITELARGIVIRKEIWGDWDWHDAPAYNRVHAVAYSMAPLHIYGALHRSKSKALRWSREHWWVRFCRKVTGIQRPVVFIQFEGEMDALDYARYLDVA